MRIIGIDPGLRTTGFGVIEVIEGSTYYVTSGIVTTKVEDSLDLRLKTIFQGINTVIKDSKPTIASIEKVFVNVNPQSTLLLGQARGAAIVACVNNNLSVSEYTALQVKQSVVGFGHADKQQVGKMVKQILKLNGEPKADAADALAIALTHLHYSKICKTFNIKNIKGGRLIG